MMKLLKFSLGELEANCYLLIEGKDCLIIDPADDASFILEELQRRQLDPAGMLATHGHFDHVMAAGEIQKSLNLPLYIHKDDNFLIDKVKLSAEYFLDYKPAILPVKKFINLNAGKPLKIKNFRLKIIHTPGHTPGSCCFYLKEKNILFTGDTLFKDGVGRTDLSYSSKDGLRKSLKRIFELPGDTTVYPGHGEETLIRDEVNSMSLSS